MLWRFHDLQAVYGARGRYAERRWRGVPPDYTPAARAGQGRPLRLAMRGRPGRGSAVGTGTEQAHAPTGSRLPGRCWREGRRAERLPGRCCAPVWGGHRHRHRPARRAARPGSRPRPAPAGGPAALGALVADKVPAPRRVEPSRAEPEPCRVLPSRAVLCCAVSCLAVPFRAVSCPAVPCRAVPCPAVPHRAVLWQRLAAHRRPPRAPLRSRPGWIGGSLLGREEAARPCEARNCPRSLLAETVPFIGKVFRLSSEEYPIA